MPQLGNKKYSYDADGMREYMKDKNAISKAKYGRSYFPMDEASKGGSLSDDEKDILKKLNIAHSERTKEGGIPSDIDGDGIPEAHVNLDKRQGNKKQTGWRRYVDKNLGVDLELLGHDLKTGNYKGKDQGHKSSLRKMMETMFKGSNTGPSAMDMKTMKMNGGPVKGINGAKNMNAPGMIKGTFNGK